MKIAILQYAPEVGKLDDNIAKADSILEKTDLIGVSWLILPELALTGYHFGSLENIRPFLEPTAAGVSTQWAKETAKKYGCKVTLGYPEIASQNCSQPAHGPGSNPEIVTSGGDISGVDNTIPCNTDHGDEASTAKLYNSTVTVDPAGTVLTHYRKRYLYTSDECWATPGPEHFFAGSVKGVGKVCMGICMDLNSDPAIELPPKPDQDVEDAAEKADRDSKTEAWVEAFTNCDFARFVVDQSPDLVVLNLAWIASSSSPESESEFWLRPAEMDMSTFQYWIRRFDPFFTDCDESLWRTVVFANRCGSEGETVYAGSSCVVKMRGDGRIRCLDFCGRLEERCMVVDLESNSGQEYRIIRRTALS